MIKEGLWAGTAAGQPISTSAIMISVIFSSQEHIKYIN